MPPANEDPEATPAADPEATATAGEDAEEGGEGEEGDEKKEGDESSEYETESESEGEEVDELPDPDDDEEPPRPSEAIDLRAWGIGVFNDRVTLAGNPHLSETHFDVIYKFMSDPDCLSVMVWSTAGPDDDEGNPGTIVVNVAHEFPTEPIKEVYFFLKQTGSYITPFTDFDEIVQHGAAHGDFLDSVAMMMKGIFSPLLSCHTNWAASVQNEFLSGMNKFMSSLTETFYQRQHVTVLYVPNEDLTSRPIDELCSDRELVQRVESTLIHWTRKIKDVLHSLSSEDVTLPLDEIEFWAQRCGDLSGIGSQLEKDGVIQLVKFLTTAKSPYVRTFDTWAAQIKDGLQQAQSNLKFLELLKGPCAKLAGSEPQDCSEVLPGIIDLIRLIQLHSDFYNSRESITGLYSKVSQSVMMRCHTHIDLTEIFETDVTEAQRKLNESIACCEGWKDLYGEREHAHRFGNADLQWGVNHDSVFAQVDAFVTRCRALLEVCRCVNQFCSKKGIVESEPPTVTGTHAPLIKRGMDSIKVSFKVILSKLKVAAGANPLFSTKWKDAYQAFKVATQELDIIVQGVIATAFKNATQIPLGLEIMEVFEPFASRDLIRRTLSKCTIELYDSLQHKVALIKRIFNDNRSTVPVRNMSPDWPKFAGAAAWAKCLQVEVQQLIDMYEKAEPVLISNITKGQEMTNAVALRDALQEYAAKTYNAWYGGVRGDLASMLFVPLMRRGASRVLLELNFDRNLLTTYQEIALFHKLGFEIPQSANEVYMKREDMRLLREHVLLVLRDYNQIIKMLSPEERDLFRERIRFLDKKIQPGMTKLNWGSPGIKDLYVAESRKHSFSLRETVDSYLNVNRQIARGCHRMSNTQLLNIDPRRTYRNAEFNDSQHDAQKDGKNQLQSMHSRIIKLMKDSYKVFRNDGPDVQHHWARYTVKTDKMIEDSIQVCVKKALIAIATLINGDGKVEPHAAFRANVVLDQDHVELEPSYNSLVHTIMQLASGMSGVCGDLPRLPALLARNVRPRPSYRDIIDGDEECSKIQQGVHNGLVANEPNIQDYIQKWVETYASIWSTPKDPFIKRYAAADPPLSKFDGDISRYDEVANNAEKEENVVGVQFLLLDSQSLKFAIVEHCRTWRVKFTTLLNERAVGDMNDLISLLAETTEKLGKVPETLDEMCDTIELLDGTTANITQLGEKFSPINEQFDILYKHEVEIDEEISNKLDGLPEEWATFQTFLELTAENLEVSRKEFKMELLKDTDILSKNVEAARKDFLKTGPFGDVGAQTALEALAGYRDKIKELTDRDAELSNGLKVFSIAHPPYKDIELTEEDLDFMDKLWSIASEFDEKFAIWQTTQFADINTSELEEEAGSRLKKIIKLQRQVKDKDWEMVEAYKKKISQFKAIMPLILDLKEPAMRDRHWKKLMTTVGKDFDPAGVDFTLGTMIELKLDEFSEECSEISQAANQELKIEVKIAEIAEMWVSAPTATLVVEEYKSGGHHVLKGTDDLFAVLEENQVTLATMKASRYVKFFSVEVDGWEKALSLILEVIEMLLTVQRQWMYLENIFKGEEISRQLPEETKRFLGIDTGFKDIMNQVVANPNANQACHRDGLLKQLTGMNETLEKIQKALDAYLETKRQVFPRFYFVSNDDLLEILGQSRNPAAVQVHLLKCFDNIKSLELQAPISKTRSHEAIGMYSADGEYVHYMKPVVLDGPVEHWLGKVEAEMRTSLRQLMGQCRIAQKKTKRDKWINDWAGQLVIAISQLGWTADTIKAINGGGKKEKVPAKKGLKSMRKKQVSLLKKLTLAVRVVKNKVTKKKLVGLITIEVHSRDVLEKLMKLPGITTDAFDWLMQLRYYWEKTIVNPDGDTVLRQTNTLFTYGYEYLGNSGRLVITPLTDRCYMTLTTALHLTRGGSPKGPAGTGKTETVKDLGKALGDYVIVVNCSEGLDYKSIGRMLSGLAQTGAWGCFDEFNRINIEVLSVVAQQVLCLLGKQVELSPDNEECRLVFEGIEINLRWSCGLFITMNPGYAGRTELPDNLKSMFRPISMMVPDSGMIAEIMLMGVGFGEAKVLAKKIFSCYSLCMMQLSKQFHYDFKLRALVSIIRNAGGKRAKNPEMPEDEIVVMACKDMNVAKMTADDLPLFLAIMGDLFPGIETADTDYGLLKNQVIEELEAQGLQATEFIIAKTLQVYETKTSRHSVMLVGPSQAGKTTAYRTLLQAMTSCNKKDILGLPKVGIYPINPKALNLQEMYGEFNVQTNEWTDGVLSSVFRDICADDKPDQKWLIFDGPVDADWIESMNSVMDDNKLLTLINGERISMPDQVSLLFECQDLAVASPATVSRAGFVYFDVNEMGWRPYFNSWCDRQTDKNLIAVLTELFERFVDKTLDYISRNCNELVHCTDINKVVTLCVLLEGLLVKGNSVTPGGKGPDFDKEVSRWFLFCLIWSVGGAVDGVGRKKMDNFIRELEGAFPPKDTVYEYFVDTKTNNWAHWESKLSAAWSFPTTMPFYKILVPTVDTLRYDYVLSSLLKSEQPALVVGPVGTGKTQLVQSVLDKLDKSKWAQLNINMSSQTTSNNVQEIIEGVVEKRTKGVFVPFQNKKLMCFVDDMNMPMKQEYGDQPPLELLQQWMEYGVWYDREKQVVKEIRGMYMVGAMGPPGGGRTEISMRLQSRFSTLNMTFPGDPTLKRIFGTIISQRLQNFNETVKPLGESVTVATLDIYKSISATMLPTPAKIHYLFNLRDISKVFQGMYRTHKDHHDTPEILQRLWVGECFRVFGDRLVGEADIAEFSNMIEKVLHARFDVSFGTLCPGKESPVFADFLTDRDVPVFEDAVDEEELRQVMDTKLDDYNQFNVAMDLVLFRYCLEHICRISRVIALPRGNMMLIGVGGSGRQSVARLASAIREFEIFMIEVTKTYRLVDFREDLKRLYRLAGVDDKKTTFLFNDTQVVDESMLEDVNNVLTSGVVPNLFAPDELEEVHNDLTPIAKKEGIDVDEPGILDKYLIDRVRNNLHIVLCMSPVGEAFRNRLRMYPGLVNCTTIDYFTPWPDDALMAVAEKYMDDVNLDIPIPGEPTGGDGDEDGERNVTEEQDHEKLKEEWMLKLKLGISKTFATIHSSVVKKSAAMLEEIRRHNYVTPINYLELVSGYKLLLAEKRAELGDKADKLANGLEKIDDTRVKVEAMGEELKITQVEVAAFQKECDEYLVVIVQQKKEADDQKKAVAARSAKISVEAAETRVMAASAQHDLDEAMPALAAAVSALDSLNKGDITEIKSYNKPPPLVALVMEGVQVLRKGKLDWANAKKSLGEGDFIKQLKEFDKDHISESTRKKLMKYITNPDFMPDVVAKVSGAGKSLCMWVRAMEVYARVFKVVGPKREALAEATAALASKQAALASAEAKLAEVTAKVEKLQSDFQAKLKTKDDLAAKAAATALKLERAKMLVEGLGGERVRWAATVKTLRANIILLVGDCLMGAGFLSYMGPFVSEYRDALLATWAKTVKEAEIPHTNNFDMSNFLAKPTDVRFWNIQGLPSDQFSTENGVIVTRGRRWPLMIDPQGQANKWIKTMERKRGLKVVDLQMPDYLRTLENAIQYGTPVLMQNVGEQLDPSLEPILNKAFVKRGGRLMLKLADKEVEFNPDFKFYITTKMSNPIYGPDISTKVTVCNFAVVLKGLEDQMLGQVVRRERLDLEQQKDELVLNIAAGNNKLVELEDRILFLLANAKGSLLDDPELLDTLNSSKITSTEVNEQLTVAVTTEKEIDEAREGYRRAATRAAILFFVLNDMEDIDPMYQFALDAYKLLYDISISKSLKSNQIETRIDNINEYHTFAVYGSTCRGLFEKDKLLFSFHLNAKIFEAASKINMQEYNFFLRGGVVLDRTKQVPNPAPAWIEAAAWDNVTEMDSNLSKFASLVDSFEADHRAWHSWFTSACPEVTDLPGEWQNSCNELQRMLIIRALRMDRVAIVVTTFIKNNLGEKFTEPPPLDVAAVVSESVATQPLIFVLSTGVDPTKNLLDLAAKRGMGDRMKTLSLGQGQAPIAEAMIKVARKEGQWVFLANCHLSLSWMPRLAKVVETMETDAPHEDFRLWLSSSPTPEFPISILQAGIKMTTEPPKGIRANMKRLYTSLTEDQFEACNATVKYKKLLLGLAFFHSIIIERRKFQMLGWNVIYPFNDSDFIICESLLSLYLEEYDNTPWDAMKYLISAVMYGGHVTDDWDRRLILVYIADLFNEDALTEGYKLSDSPAYATQPHGDMQSYLDYLGQLPAVDPPGAFGQHPNADISSMIREASDMLGTLVGLQAVVAGGEGQSDEERVGDMAADIEEKVPLPIDLEGTKKQMKGDESPLNVVLFQEIERYNVLLIQIKEAVIDVQKGIKGTVVMSSELEETYACMLNSVVPPSWKKIYPSMKPLAAWVLDLIDRIAMFAEWATTHRPPVIFWMSAFSFPTGFLTAVLQSAARSNNVAIDSLGWDFTVQTLDDVNIVEPPRDGAFIRGIFLEGAGWDKKNVCLVEAPPMQLTAVMPTILFRPIEVIKTKAKKGSFAAPLYYYPNRAGEGGAVAWSFVIAVDVKAGEYASDHWTKRGTALLMSLDR